MIDYAKRFFSPEFMAFLIVGTLGFGIDAGILFLSHLFFGLVISRMISFTVAVTCTWVLNRLFTFHSNDRGLRSEWLRYVVVNMVGGLINFAGFIFLIKKFGVFHQHILLALMVTTGVVAVFNYLVSKEFAFKQVLNDRP